MAAQGGFGLVLKIDVSGTPTAITGVLDAEFPGQEKTLAEATAHDSPGGYKEYIATGLRELTAFKATLAWDVSETTHSTVLAAFDSDDPVDMSIQDPDGDEVIAFSAHVAKIGRVSAKDEVYQAEVEIQPTGQPTIT